MPLAEMRALITGCGQNCAGTLPAVLKNIEQLRALFHQSEVLLLENDSTDATAELIRRYGQSHDGVHALGFPGLNARIPIKTVRLAHLRNTALEWLRSNGGWGRFDLLVVLDLDEVNAAPWDLQALSGALQWWQAQPEAAGLFANQLGPYYDLWALRHASLCPDDVWAAMLQEHGRQPELSDQELLEQVYLPRQFSLQAGAAPLEVDSAFGGLAFYSCAWLARAEPRYVGEQPLVWDGPLGRRWLRWQCCEHVAFHRQLRTAGGRLWIHPGLINWNTQAAGIRPNPSSWRHLALA
jgi:glycosyltransferase involved in cell wall biosynthesis